MNDKMNLLKNITCYNYAVGNHTYLERLRLPFTRLEDMDPTA